MIAFAILAGNLLIERSGDGSSSSEAAEPDRPVVVAITSETPDLVAFNLAAEAESLRLEVAAARLEEQQDAFAAAQRRKARLAEFADLPGSVTRVTLESIASCESGGDPRIVSADGLYHGKYQFSPDTWESVGGEGLPSKAPEAEQDYRAALLYERSGPGQWPVCGS